MCMYGERCIFIYTYIKNKKRLANCECDFMTRFQRNVTRGVGRVYIGKQN